MTTLSEHHGIGARCYCDPCEIGALEYLVAETRQRLIDATDALDDAQHDHDEANNALVALRNGLAWEAEVHRSAVRP